MSLRTHTHTHTTVLSFVSCLTVKDLNHCASAELQYSVSFYFPYRLVIFRSLFGKSNMTKQWGKKSIKIFTVLKHQWQYNSIPGAKPSCYTLQGDNKHVITLSVLDSVMPDFVKELSDRHELVNGIVDWIQCLCFSLLLISTTKKFTYMQIIQSKQTKLQKARVSPSMYYKLQNYFNAWHTFLITSTRGLNLTNL